MKVFANRIMLGVVAFSCLACIAAAANLSGTWKGTITDADGEKHDLTLNLKVDGNKLTGTIGGLPQGSSEDILNGHVAGKRISFDAKGARHNGSTVTLTFSGEVSGNNIKGSFSVPDVKASLAVTVTKQ